MSAKLTPKQALFVQEYLVDLCATQAAIRAGYSKKTADSIGLQLLRKTTVSAAISEAMKKRIERTEWTQDDVLRELIETYRHARTEKQISSAVSALVNYGKHIGMFTDKLDVTSGGRTLSIVTNRLKIPWLKSEE